MGSAEVVGEPPASRTSALKAKMLAKKEPAALDVVLSHIAAANGKDGMATIRELANKLSKEDKEIATVAYKNRMAELKAAASHINKETGEVSEPMTFAKVASALESSKDRDTLDLALDMIRLVADEQQREELAVIGRSVAAVICQYESATSQA
jgi:hypothetical protein